MARSRFEAHVARGAATVFGTRWASLPADLRVPFATTTRTGNDGQTPFWQQLKFPDYGADIPLATGTEVRLIQAEAALQAGDVAESIGLINHARAPLNLAELPVPATMSEAWALLMNERGADLYLEGRRLWDLRRWFAEGLIGEWKELAGHDKCIPISQAERASNPNLGG